METSRFDRVLQKIQIRTDRVSSKIAKDLGKVKPFDKEPVKDDVQVQDFLNMSPEIRQYLQQQDPEGYAQYEQSMNKKIIGRQGNA